MDVQRNPDFIFELFLVIWAIGAIGILFTQARNKRSLKSSLLTGTAINLIYAVTVSLIWFFAVAIDGVSQVLVVYFFGGIFLILEVLLLIVLLIVKRKNKPPFKRQRS
jgi:thiamine transporter ThiT